MKRAEVQRGFTLVELLLAVALGSILLLALTRLLDTTLNVWGRTETRRNMAEQGMGIAERLARDLRALHGGAQGDLVFDWVKYDLDADGVRERPWPRLRLVRQASPSEVERHARGAERAQFASGLLEVAWVLVPASKQVDAHCEARLLRGERLLDDGGQSYFARDFFDSQHSPPAGALDPVSEGVLWFNLFFASQTSILHDGWYLGRNPADVSACWDAWRKGRPDPLLHRWNEPTEGLPAVEGVPLLPRRVRLELELETAQQRARRTRLAEALDATAATVEVESGQYLPRTAGAHVLIEREWMEVLEVRGDSLRVRRAARGTDASPHPILSVVHHGDRVLTEVPIPLYLDEWQ